MRKPGEAGLAFGPAIATLPPCYGANGGVMGQGGWISGAVAALIMAASPAARAQDAETATIRTLPPDDGHRLYVTDFTQDHLVDSRATVVDGKTLRYLGNLPMGNFGSMNLSRDRARIFIATTYYDRGSRGHRADIVEEYAATTLGFTREVVLPSKRALAASYTEYLQPSAHDRFLLVQNATPASSVTIVDEASFKVLSELPTAGCFGLYPDPSDDARFSTLCGDGGIVTITLDAAGHETARAHIGKLFDPVADPVFITGGIWGGKLVLVSFQGVVHVIDLAGGTPRQTAVWSLIQSPAAQAWRPGGYQLFSVHAASGQLFIGMHPHGFDGSHKAPSAEIWQADLASRKVTHRFALHGALAVTVSQDATPTLYTITYDGLLQAWGLGDKLAPKGKMRQAAEMPNALVLR